MEMRKYSLFNFTIVFTVQTEWNMTRIKLPVGLPELNLSQRQAVNRALNSSFTLVWGPPGKPPINGYP